MNPRLRRWWYGGVVVLLVCWGLWARFRLPLTPFADLDAWHFLNPALSCLAGKGFFHTEGGTFVYPAFLLGVLGWAPDLRAVAVVQHVLGWAAHGCCCWRGGGRGLCRSRRSCPDGCTMPWGW